MDYMEPATNLFKLAHITPENTYLGRIHSEPESISFAFFNTQYPENLSDRNVRAFLSLVKKDTNVCSVVITFPLSSQHTYDVPDNEVAGNQLVTWLNTYPAVSDLNNN